MFATTVPICTDHFRIVPVPVFRVETKNTVSMMHVYPVHNWAPYRLFTMIYARVPYFYLWRGQKHPSSFQLRQGQTFEIDKTLRGDWPGPLRQVPHERTA